ncbi:hypothetical protein TNIN_228211 [Trichonephila inaurata madagascariensis]|uniref:Uncharacterized protein n=1 Tax=Trichonephila inaurata madagascariensis TaxID=2747483 RepID=A0A8X7CKA9_9ARAC|nr:hypothetical protein TNIN_228211 [Trichonephila inaurata madagascariensis]
MYVLTRKQHNMMKGIKKVKQEWAMDQKVILRAKLYEVKAKNDLIQREKDILKEENDVLKTKEHECKTRENELNSKLQVDIANLLVRKNGAMFAKRFPYDIILGHNVLPRTQKYPKQTACADLVTRYTTIRITRHENLELAKKFSNALDTGCAYVQGKRTFASSYKQSPKLFVVNTPNESIVKVAQWIREFTLDLELQRKKTGY